MDISGWLKLYSMHTPKLNQATQHDCLDMNDSTSSSKPFALPWVIACGERFCLRGPVKVSSHHSQAISQMDSNQFDRIEMIWSQKSRKPDRLFSQRRHERLIEMPEERRGAITAPLRFVSFLKSSGRLSDSKVASSKKSRCPTVAERSQEGGNGEKQRAEAPTCGPFQGLLVGNKRQQGGVRRGRRVTKMLRCYDGNKQIRFITNPCWRSSK